MDKKTIHEELAESLADGGCGQLGCAVFALGMMALVAYLLLSAVMH